MHRTATLGAVCIALCVSSCTGARDSTATHQATADFLYEAPAYPGGPLKSGDAIPGSSGTYVYDASGNRIDNQVVNVRNQVISRTIANRLVLQGSVDPNATVIVRSAERVREAGLPPDVPAQRHGALWFDRIYVNNWGGVLWVPVLVTARRVDLEKKEELVAQVRGAVLHD
jgi:hypothetical protein